MSGKNERAPARLSVLVSEPATRRTYKPQTGRWFSAARVTIVVRQIAATLKSRRMSRLRPWRSSSAPAIGLRTSPGKMSRKMDTPATPAE